MKEIPGHLKEAFEQAKETKYLCLSDKAITDDFVETILIEFLAKWKITKLDLSKNKLTFRSVEQLAKIELQELDLSYTKVGSDSGSGFDFNFDLVDEASKKIGKIFAEYKSLRILKLNSSLVKDAAVYQIIQNKHIKQLSLLDNQISEEGKEKLDTSIDLAEKFEKVKRVFKSALSQSNQPNVNNPLLSFLRADGKKLMPIILNKIKPNSLQRLEYSTTYQKIVNINYSGFSSSMGTWPRIDSPLFPPANFSVGQGVKSGHGQKNS